MIKIGKRTGDMKLRNYARSALSGLLQDDGTPGLGDYLWKEIVMPNYKKALERKAYLEQNGLIPQSN